MGVIYDRGDSLYEMQPTLETSPLGGDACLWLGVHQED